MEGKCPHLASPIDYKAVNGGGIFMLIRMLVMGGEKRRVWCSKERRPFHSKRGGIR
jgi:hypothetical protein